MKVKILLDLPRTINGKNVGPFRKGAEIEMDDAQVSIFIGSAMAEEVLPVIEVEVIEIADSEASNAENESADPAPRRSRKRAD